jgi:hypothetical protein
MVAPGCKEMEAMEMETVTVTGMEMAMLALPTAARPCRLTGETMEMETEMLGQVKMLALPS